MWFVNTPPDQDDNPTEEAHRTQTVGLDAAACQRLSPACGAIAFPFVLLWPEFKPRRFAFRLLLVDALGGWNEGGMQLKTREGWASILGLL